ncbi:MAG: hypothetical protein AB8B82_16940 [Roseovarius sp.]
MARTQWHILKEDDALIVARRVPVRFDLAVETRLVARRKLRLAHQVRQDVWRALQGLRGFAPAVRIVAEGDALKVTAGGQVDGRFARAAAQARIRDVLEHPANRARWQRCAA